MPIQFHPKPGAILMCAFPDEHLHGEMVKKRPVVILSRKIQGRPKLVSLVPISMTQPLSICDHHIEIGRMSMPKGMRDRVGTRWAKCDMVYTMSIDRLEQVRGHRGHNGKRIADTGMLAPATLLAIRLATAACLGITAESFASVAESVDYTVRKPAVVTNAADSDKVESVDGSAPLDVVSTDS